MSGKKTATVTFRIDPQTKEALQHAAGQERRSLANMIEVMIRDYCKRHDIAIDGVEAGPIGDREQ
ncbi:MAG: hypothetical protein Hals2KO_26450 [Halioglobus sp.]